MLDAAIYLRHQHHYNANAVAAGGEVTLQALAQAGGGGGGVEAVFERLRVQGAREYALKVMHAADEEAEAMLLLAEVHTLPAQQHLSRSLRLRVDSPAPTTPTIHSKSEPDARLKSGLALTPYLWWFDSRVCGVGRTWLPISRCCCARRTNAPRRLRLHCTPRCSSYTRATANTTPLCAVEPPAWSASCAPSPSACCPCRPPEPRWRCDQLTFAPTATKCGRPYAGRGPSAWTLWSLIRAHNRALGVSEEASC